MQQGSSKSVMDSLRVEYIGSDREVDLALLSGSPLVRQVLSRGETVITSIAATKFVRVWKVKIAGRETEWVIKWTPPSRLMDSAAQVMAEMQAGTVLHSVVDPLPVMCLPMGLDVSPLNGAFTFSVYAGESLDTLLAPGGEWHSMTRADRLLMAKSFAASALLVRKINDELPAELGGPMMHRDIKPSNTCWRMVDGQRLMVVMDFGGWCRQDMAAFHPVMDMTHLDCLLAGLSPNGDSYECQSGEGVRRSTHHTMDFFQVGLGVVELFNGKLPDAIDPFSHEELNSFLEAVRTFDWAKCPEVLSMPPDAQQFVLWCLSADPSRRPQTGEEALAHPFVSDTVQLVKKTAEAAADSWCTAHVQLHEDLYGPPSNCSIPTFSSCSAPAATAAGTHSSSSTCALQPETPRVSASRGSDASSEGLCETNGCTSSNDGSSSSTRSSSQGPAVTVGSLEVAAANAAEPVSQQAAAACVQYAPSPVISLPPAAALSNHAEPAVHVMLVVLQADQAATGGPCSQAETITAAAVAAEAPAVEEHPSQAPSTPPSPSAVPLASAGVCPAARQGFPQDRSSDACSMQGSSQDRRRGSRIAAACGWVCGRMRLGKACKMLQRAGCEIVMCLS